MGRPSGVLQGFMVHCTIVLVYSADCCGSVDNCFNFAGELLRILAPSPPSHFVLVLGKYFSGK